MSYELQLRKRMSRLVTYEGLTIGRALLAARQDVEVKNRFFVTPLSFAAATAQREPRQSGGYDRVRPPGPTRPSPWGAKSGKGTKNKGGKDSKNNAPKDWHSETPDGRKICFAWNNRDEQCRGGCGFVHVCRRCFGDHPAHACRMPPKGKGKADSAPQEAT